MVETDRATREYTLGVDLASSAHFQEALPHLLAARDLFTELGLDVALGQCQQTLGNVYRSLGNPDASRTAYHAARQAFRGQECALDRAVCDYSLGNLEFELRHLHAAEARYNSARATFEVHHSLVHVARCDLALGNIHLELGRLAAAASSYQLARGTFAANDLEVDAARCDLGLGHVDRERSRPEAANLRYGYARHVFEKRGLRTEAAKCDFSVGRLDADAGNLRAARAKFEVARRAFTKGGRVVDAAHCDFVSAQMLEEIWRTRRPREGEFGSVDAGPSAALRVALRALLSLEETRYRLHRPTDRQEWLTLFTATYETTFKLAALCREQELLAELLESIRAQAVPASLATERSGRGPLDLLIASPGSLAEDGSPILQDQKGPDAEARAFRSSDLDLAAATAAAGVFPLSPNRQVTIAGRSRVSELAAPGSALPHERVDLRDLAEEVHGPGGWWWGMWRIVDRLYWCLVDPDGTPTAGWLSYPTSTLRRYAHAIGLALPDETRMIQVMGRRDKESVKQALRDAVAARVLAGPLWCDPEAAQRKRDEAPALVRRLPPPDPATTADEKMLALALGVIIPSDLAAALRERPPDAPPVPVTIAPAPELARLPYALMAVPGMPPLDTPGGLDPPRLLEQALLRFAPSVPFLDALTRQPSQSGESPPLVISIIDPHGDLPHAAWAPTATTHLFTHRQSRRVPRPPEATLRRATETNVTDFLRTVEPGARGILLCRTHHELGNPGDPLNSGGLLLSEGTTLSPGAFLRAPSLSRPNSPHAAMLVGCDTMGAAIGSEWTTLSTALLWAGANYVITTLWPVFDSMAATTFENELAELLLSENDPAESLRRLQLERLEVWRSENGIASDRAPYMWAAYTLTTGPCQRRRASPKTDEVRSRNSYG